MTASGVDSVGEEAAAGKMSVSRTLGSDDEEEVHSTERLIMSRLLTSVSAVRIRRESQRVRIEAEEAGERGREAQAEAL